MFLWTAFPVTAAIESIFDLCKADVDETWSTDWSLSAPRVELVSILERLKHYNESGNVKTLPYAALKADRSGSYRHLVLTGWPFLGDIATHKNVVDGRKHRSTLIMGKLPWDTKRDTVASSATASIKHHYGNDAEQVRITTCAVRAGRMRQSDLMRLYFIVFSFIGNGSMCLENYSVYQ
jgi:hypothetical protein